MERLLCRPRPKPGESLTGYLMRVSETNVLPLTDLLKRVNSRYKSPVRGCHAFDLYGSELMDITKLCQLVDISRREANQMTMISVWGKFDLNLFESQSTRNFLSDSIVSSHRRFCPQCLYENRTYCLLWQISDLTVCIRHKTKLMSQCSNCSSFQPYFSESLKNYICCNCGSILSALPSETVKDSQIQIEQEEKWNEWRFLLNGKGQAIYPDEEFNTNALLISKLLFIGQKDKNVYKASERIIHSKYIRAVREKPSGVPSKHVVPLSRIFRIIREAHLPIWKLHEISVPRRFLQSVVNPIMSQYVCQAPWCKYYGTSKNILRETNQYRVLHEGIWYNLYSICAGCGIEYGIDRTDGIWKSVGNMIELITQIRELLLKGLSRTKAGKVLGISMLKAQFITGYLAYQNLLPVSLIQKFKPRVKYNGDVLELFKHIAETTGKFYSWDSYKATTWNRTEYFYYLASTEIRMFLVLELKKKSHLSIKRQSALEASIVKERTISALRELTFKNITISHARVEALANLPSGSIHRNGFSELVKNSAKEQAILRFQQRELRLKNSILEYFIHKRDFNRKVSLIEVSKSIGFSRSMYIKYPKLKELAYNLINNSNNEVSGIKLKSIIEKEMSSYLREASATSESE